MNCDVRWFIDFSSKKIAPFCKINFENQVVWCLKNARMWLKDFCDLRTSCFQSCLPACHMQKSHLYFSMAFNKACLTSSYIMLPPKLCEFGKTHIQLWGRSVCWTSALGHNRDLQHHCKLSLSLIFSSKTFLEGQIQMQIMFHWLLCLHSIRI